MKETRGKLKSSTKLINVSIRSHTSHYTGRGTSMQFHTRDQVKDFLMSIAYNEKPVDICIY